MKSLVNGFVGVVGVVGVICVIRVVRVLKCISLASFALSRCGRRFSELGKTHPSLSALSSATCGQVRVGFSHIQLCAPKVVAMAVRMVIRMLRILPQVELLLKVPIVLNDF